MIKGLAWRSVVGVLPGAAVALLPNLACPACWPAYAAALGAVGLGFLLEEAWLLPLSAVFLPCAVAAMAWQARSRRGYAPAVVGSVAATAIMVGKFMLQDDVVSYVGVAGLLVASAWNVWPRRTRKTAESSSCAGTASC